MIGIFYFSSTGNSLFIAERIKAELGGEIRYIPKFAGDINTYEKIIIVSPVHSFGLPLPVYDFIAGMQTSKPLYIVLNYGGMKGNSLYFAYSLCKDSGLNIRSVQVVKMPENFTLSFSQPRFYLNSVLRKAPERLVPVIAAIGDDVEIAIPEPKSNKSMEKHFENRKTWHRLAKDFSVTEHCTGCLKCVRLCPVGNISREDGQIIFGDACIACLGCYHRCPEKAIVYKNRRKKDRYINPHVQEKHIGADQL